MRRHDRCEGDDGALSPHARPPLCSAPEEIGDKQPLPPRACVSAGRGGAQRVPVRGRRLRRHRRPPRHCRAVRIRAASRTLSPRPPAPTPRRTASTQRPEPGSHAVRLRRNALGRLCPRSPTRSFPSSGTTRARTAGARSPRCGAAARAWPWRCSGAACTRAGAAAASRRSTTRSRGAQRTGREGALRYLGSALDCRERIRPRTFSLG